MTGRLVELEYSRHASKAKIMKSNLIWVIGICAMASLLLYLNTNILTITVVSGNSIYPTVENGDVLLVDKVNRNVSKGDVILAKIMDSDREYIIKRVIATGGEEVTIDYSKNAVMVNGMLLDEPYICLAEADPMLDLDGVTTINYTVPYGCLFVMGDNRNHSADSRNQEIGFIPEKGVVGKIRGLVC